MSFQNVRGGRRKAGSGATEQGTDQQGRSGGRRGNEQVQNKFKLATRLKAREKLKSGRSATYKKNANKATM